MNENGSSPVIFIGMHRSGTSMLGRLLEKLGLFVGEKRDENNEAVFFNEINSWIMAQCGARWDQPSPISDLWSDTSVAVKDASKEYICDLMRSPLAARYLGIARYFKNGSIQSLQGTWGWKDPRNTYTLPFWLEIFPNARVVFIERHGVDVAESLRVRAEQSVESTQNVYQKYRSVAWLRPKRGGFCESPRCLTLEGGISLWEQYQAESDRLLGSLPENRSFRIRYEDLLADPENILTNVAKFCGLSPSNAKVKGVTESINASRAFSYRRNVELLRFAESNAMRLGAWGYKP